MGGRKTDNGADHSPKDKAAAERAERLRKQLRANLQRRKAQARARSDKTENEQD